MNIFILLLLVIVIIGVLFYFLAPTKINSNTIKQEKGIREATRKARQKKERRKEKILILLTDKGEVANNNVEELLGVSDATATNYLQELEEEGKIEQVGEKGRFVTYRLL